MTDNTGSNDSTPDNLTATDGVDDSPADAAPETGGAKDPDTGEKKKKSALREGATLVAIAIVLYYVMLTFIARPYLIPSESMEPTLHGCPPGCVGDRIMVDKVTYRFGGPAAG